MDNLRELSKPVGFIEQSGMDYLRSGADADIWPDGGRGDDIPLYSQEYVSALTQRIDELEAVKADAAQVFKEIGNELGCNPDNESIMMAIDALKERLATPVRLTEERTLWAGEDDYDTGHVKGWNANRIEQAALLKKQGFTVEGDE